VVFSIAARFQTSSILALCPAAGMLSKTSRIAETSTTITRGRWAARWTSRSR
jgi:hypothetical protein